MKTDLQIQKDVMEEIRWEPYLNASEIGVAVKNGVVTLSGTVDAYFKKLTAEKAAKRVKGVKALAEDIQIGVSPASHRTDTDIASEVIDSLKWHSAVQEEKIKIKVENGNVRLEGTVDWDFERANAANAIAHLTGVRSVLNFINVKPRLTSEDIKKNIISAYRRNATIDANNIKVEVKDHKAILRGTVRSLAEKEDALHAVWAAPGITAVDNLLQVEVPELIFED